MTSRRLVGTPRYYSSHALRSWRALGLCLMVVMMSSSAYGKKRASAPGDVFRGGVSLETTHVEPAQDDGDLQECWVFNHLLKAGGQTTKGILNYWHRHARIGDRIFVDTYEVYQWLEGGATAELMGSGQGHDSYLVMGSYVEALHPYTDRCKWFTVFRHPISRVVSAYYHCHINPADPLCATVIADAKTIDLLTFAELWSNYGLRQFALAFVPQEAMLKSDTAKECPDCPGWYFLKKYFETTAKHSQNPEDMDGDMADLVKPVCERLQNDYAAVGLLENYNATMHLFNRALQLPGMDWAWVADKVGRRNTHDKAVQLKIAEHQALVTAWGDRRLYKILELDILLYGCATAVHRMQLAQHDLGPSRR